MHLARDSGQMASWTCTSNIRTADSVPCWRQLRLQREVDEVSALPPEVLQQFSPSTKGFMQDTVVVQLLLEPEQLRATVTIGALPSSLAPWQDASPRDAVMHLEVCKLHGT
eukprot:858522-Amphidinium_carterae.1